MSGPEDPRRRAHVRRRGAGATRIKTGRKETKTRRKKKKKLRGREKSLKGWKMTMMIGRGGRSSTTELERGKEPGIWISIYDHLFIDYPFA